MREKYQGFVLYRQTGQGNDIVECRGKLPWFYQLPVPAVWGLKLRIEKQKVKVSATPRECGGGGGAVVTDDLCIIKCVFGVL